MPDSSIIDSLPDRSEQVQELLGRQPMWMVRWGTVLVLGIILVMGVLSWVVKYPEVIRAPILLVSSSPPIDIHARNSGRITQLFVQDSQWVAKGEALALLENSANWEDIQQLSGLLDSLQWDPQRAFSPAYNSSVSQSLKLGIIQVDYTRFKQAWTAFQSYRTFSPLNKERYSLGQALLKQEDILKGIEAQQPGLDRELLLAEKEFARRKQLLSEQVIAQTEVEAAERSLLEVKSRQATLNTQVAELALRMAEKRSELSQLNVQQPDLEIRMQEEFLSSLDQLASALQSWEREFLLKAPIDGRVTFFNYWSSDQFVRREEPIMTLVPADSAQMMGKVRLPLKNSGKVAHGQKVLILLDNYPFQEFGSLSGQIEQMSLVPQDTFYALDVSLPPNLTTNYQYVIPFRQELRGQAEIITEDMRLLERILYQLRKAWRGRVR